MSFFGRPVRPTGGVARAVVVNPPAWTGPPHNVLPGIAPVQLIVARTDEKVVAIAGIQTSKESRAEIDAASILEAAGGAVTLWRRGGRSAHAA